MSAGTVCLLVRSIVEHASNAFKHVLQVGSVGCRSPLARGPICQSVVVRSVRPAPTPAHHPGTHHRTCCLFLATYRAVPCFSPSSPRLHLPPRQRQTPHHFHSCAPKLSPIPPSPDRVEDNLFYGGTVESYREEDGMHRVQYLDGDEEWLEARSSPPEPLRALASSAVHTLRSTAPARSDCCCGAARRMRRRRAFAASSGEHWRGTGQRSDEEQTDRHRAPLPAVEDGN